MNQMAQIPEAKAVPTLPTYDARDLIKEGSQIGIVLDDQHYVLRITRAGKLILTK